MYSIQEKAYLEQAVFASIQSIFPRLRVMREFINKYIENRYLLQIL
jgi:hypothetical protein